MGKSVSTPPAPDYTKAAEATAAGNRVNQITPYGSLTYSEGPLDTKGNQTWTANVSLSPEQQQLLDIQNRTSLGLGNLQQQGLGYVSNMMANPFDTSSLPQTGINAGETMTDSIMRRLQPQIAQQQQSFDAKMANQGIPVGSEAYKRAYRDFAAGQNDARTSAIVGGMNTGLQANQQAYNQQLANADLAMRKYNLPLAQLAAFQNASQPGYVNPYNQAATPGADYTSAMGLTNQSQQANANAQNAYQNSLMSGLFKLGGSFLG